MSLSKQKDKKIGIFGLGITGTSVYKKLINIAEKLICWDDSEINKEAFITEFGKQNLLPIDDNKWIKLDKIIVSPGVSHTHQIFWLASKNKIPITSDIELFIEENSKSEFIFITGTNGKSTVTALTGHILEQAGFDYHIGGNIGTAVMSLPNNRKGYIFELSSFQIELLKKINPKISVITNITPDHLGRHGTIETYATIKERIFTPDAIKIIGINSIISRNIYDKFKKQSDSKIVPIYTSEKITGGIFCNDNYLRDNTEDIEGYRDDNKVYSDVIDANCQNNPNNKLLSNPLEIEFPLPSLQHLQGHHNKENIAIAYAICRALLVPSSFIIKSLESFKGLDHRMQFIGSYKNINFYNDSKATNISSSLASLSAFNDIIWFAGGKFKEDSFDDLQPILKNIKKAYFFGESKNLFAKFLDSNQKSKPEYEVCEDLEEAFVRSIEYSKNKTDKFTFLLAPACASYDQFKNFEERGKLFVKLVQNIGVKSDTL